MFLADFHVHSKFSRATSRNLDLEHLHIAAQRKGVSVVGTGDFTHPGWHAEICDKLVPCEGGLLRLRPDLAAACDRQVPQVCRRPVRFVLSAEISNIYKKGGKTRKNHNLIVADSLETVTRLNRRLEALGNIRSDGRPILGLDARDLLETVLSVSEAAFLIPAHIWTPWFSLLGSKSGFDSIAECFGDLSEEIFALETGLSSDPPMNWRVSALDGRTLVSNSDAHSPAKLAREANMFGCEMGYGAIRDALVSGDPERFLGTVEFYPEEGKYHFDGHRKCGVRLAPEQTRKLGGGCPVCGRPLTLGVLYRVEELADRPPGRRPGKSADFVGLVPLADLLSELFQVGTQSKKVHSAVEKMLNRFGSEFDILYRLDPDRLESFPVPLLAEAIRRMRSRSIVVEPGFDGEFGKVRIFSEQERRHMLGQTSLFSCALAQEPEKLAGAQLPPKNPVPSAAANAHAQGRAGMPHPDRFEVEELNPEQRSAVAAEDPALVVVAGPGTGKTRVLTCRIAHMIDRRHVAPEEILALTFTNQAADEMAERLAKMSGEAGAVTVGTFHRLCLSLLQEQRSAPVSLLDEDGSRQMVEIAMALARNDGFRIEAGTAKTADRIFTAKQNLPRGLTDPTAEFDDPALAQVFIRYQRLLKIQGLYDYDDLILETGRRMAQDPAWCRRVRNRFRHIFIDEYQDVNQGQYELVRILMPHVRNGRSFCVIGDPDQSIYGFRGSDCRYFLRFSEDYPEARTIELARNYRSTETILQASAQVINGEKTSGARLYSGIRGWPAVGILACRSERAEAVAVGRLIEEQVGGTGFHAVDFGRVDPRTEAGRSFADFAVLARTARQLDVLEEVLDRAGIPVQTVRKDRRYAGHLAPLLCMIRLVRGCPTYHDLDVLLAQVGGGVGAKTLFHFKAWAYRNRLTGAEAFKKAWRIPIPEMPRSGQKRLCEAIRLLTVLSESTCGASAAETLRRAAQALKIDDAIRRDEDMRGRFEQLLEEAAQNGPSVEGLLRRIALKTDPDVMQPRAESVSLMTLHAAKGLEFPVVIIAGCEEGLIPLQREEKTPHHRLLEEKRLFYVGMTRAKERLYLTWSRTRRLFGKKSSSTISSFVADIEHRLIEAREAQEGRMPPPTQQQLELFT